MAGSRCKCAHARRWFADVQLGREGTEEGMKFRLGVTIPLTASEIEEWKGISESQTPRVREEV